MKRVSKGLALVTGASAGIGWELARQLAARGYDLALAARRESRLRALAERAQRDSGARSEILVLDLARAGDRARLVAWMEAARERLSLVVNNAGFGYVGPAERLDAARALEMIDVNVAALTELSLAAARLLRSGAIVNVASTAAFQPVPYMAVYAATKAYVLSFTEALAYELRDTGVRAMALCPGYTRTEFQQVAGAVSPDDERGRSVMSAEECARIALDDLERGKTRSVTGLFNKVMTFVSPRAPQALVLRAAARMMQGRWEPKPPDGARP